MLKRLVKWLAPPALVDLYHAASHGRHLGFIWKGIYRTYADVPTAGPGFDGERWVDGATGIAEMLITASEGATSIPYPVSGRHALLPLLATSIRREQGPVVILDVGGGAGVHYLYLRSSIGRAFAIEYHVVEAQSICERGAQLFHNDSAIRFHATLPELDPKVDIAHLGNVLQFVEDYGGLLERICSYEPSYVLVTNLPAGDMRTYATTQRNVRGSTIATWFFNIDQIAALLMAHDYSLVLRIMSDEIWNQDNFPRDYRIGRPCHLLFARSRPTGA